MALQLQLRRGTAAEWAAANPVLAEGELGVELDTHKVKIGDGETAWSALVYSTNNLVVTDAAGNPVSGGPFGALKFTGGVVLSGAGGEATVHVPPGDATLRADFGNGDDPAKGDALAVVKVAGATTVRTQHTRNDDFHTVQDHGGAANGVADDTAAANEAVAVGKPVLALGSRLDLGGLTRNQKPVLALRDGRLIDVADTVSHLAHRPLELIAHRGFRYVGTQNTMPAFSYALAAGAQALECDVQFTLDGYAVLFHDTTLDAQTNGTGDITLLPLAAVQAARYDELQGTPYADTQIPLFETVLRLARRAGVRVYPEIKNIRSNADIDLMLDLIEAHDMEDLCVVNSFSFSQLEYVRTLNRRVRIGWLSSTHSAANLARLAELGRSFLLYEQAVLTATPAIVVDAYARGVDVGAWTINHPDDVRKLMEIGVNKIIADHAVGRTL